MHTQSYLHHLQQLGKSEYLWDINLNTLSEVNVNTHNQFQQPVISQNNFNIIT